LSTEVSDTSDAENARERLIELIPEVQMIAGHISEQFSHLLLGQSMYRQDLLTGPNAGLNVPYSAKKCPNDGAGRQIACHTIPALSVLRKASDHPGPCLIR
jgi:hypothetical protein